MLLCTYNILADGYINPAWYTGVPAALLQPAPRRAALLRRVTGLDADVLCLQEVEAPVFQALLAELGPRG